MVSISVQFTNAKGKTVLGNGFGQTIAVVVAFIADPNIASDLRQFDRAIWLAQSGRQVRFLAPHDRDAQGEAYQRTRTGHRKRPSTSNGRTPSPRRRELFWSRLNPIRRKTCLPASITPEIVAA